MNILGVATGWSLLVKYERQVCVFVFRCDGSFGFVCLVLDRGVCMSDKRMCPIRISGECLREGCHWWLADWTSCSMKVIAMKMKNVVDE